MIIIKSKQIGNIEEGEGTVSVKTYSSIFKGYSLGELMVLIAAAQDKAIEDFDISNEELLAEVAKLRNVID